ncbi:MAG: hypothetical protein GY760_04010 [Deltaproteobacteria bacterium]|nr:hypothetical protein [Deltaproteobacteria bacterium]
MDHNKISSSNFLSQQSVSTPYGYVCVEFEVKCTRCGFHTTISVPDADNAVKRIDNEDQTGTFLIEYLLEESNWLWSGVKRKNGNSAHYFLCPDCVEKDFS